MLKPKFTFNFGKSYSFSQWNPNDDVQNLKEQIVIYKF